MFRELTDPHLDTDLRLPGSGSTFRIRGSFNCCYFTVYVLVIYNFTLIATQLKYVRWRKCYLHFQIFYVTYVWLRSVA